jgi:uncharacterized protein YhaN
MKRLKISEVHDLQFGRHTGRSFDGLGADFVVVHGPNESGKSTLAEFLTWAIGGPWRTFANNTEAFRGTGDGKLGGRLLGTLGADPVDLQARFELLKAGPPRDKRTGHVGATQVDGASFQKFMGDISPADFELMYRCYGATLGDIGSGGSFENLFAQFAMGSTAGVRNPRQALDGLRRSADAANKFANGLMKEIREIDKRITSAKANPDTVAKLLAEREGITRHIASLDDELAGVERRRLLLARVIDGSDYRVSLDRARSALSDQPAVSPEWATLVDNHVEIADLVARIVSGSRAVDDAAAELVAAAAATGMEVERFEGATFSAPERLAITDATSALMTARGDLTTARVELAECTGQRNDAEAAVSKMVREVGLDEAELARLEVIETQLPDLVNRAGRWLEDTNKVIEAEAQLVGESERVKVAEGAPAPEATTRSLDPKLVALAVLVVAGASIVHWGAAIAVAVGVASFFLIGRSSRPAGQASGPNLVADTTNLANLQSRVAEHRRSAESHRQLLDEGLGSLARVVTTVDLAQRQLQQLGALASQIRAMHALAERAASQTGRVADLELAVTDAEREVSELLEPRGISLSMVNGEFATWLTKYEAAVGASASLAAARSALAKLHERLSELSAPVASEVSGLTPQAIAARVDEAKETASKRRAAEDAVRQAEAQVRGADLDSPEALAILGEFPDLADLQVQREISESRATAIRTERDESNARLGEIRGEVERLEATEVLPGLLLEKGDLDDRYGEAVDRHQTLARAYEVLAAAVDEHERLNQDPVVARASDLVAEIVPDWGTIIKSRDDDGKLLIQRLRAEGRVGDHAISDGGRALLYLAVRLAFAQQDASRRGVTLPIICDDPLIHFDDTRQEAAIRLLRKVSDSHQIILFTCESATRDHAASLGASVVEM